MQSTSRHVPPNYYWMFLVGLSLLLMVIGGIVTSKYGAGVASDSVKYLGVAQSLKDGNGLFDHRGSPLLSWPPLYPALIAGLSLLTRSDVFRVAWYLNIFILGLNLFLSGVIFYRVFPDRPLYAYLCTAFVFLSNPNLRMHSVVSSDPLYLTAVFALVLGLGGYIARRSIAPFLTVLILSALTPLLRYVGLAIGTTAGLVILIENRRAVRVLLRDGLILGLAVILPIAWWLVIHNVMTYGSLWGLETQTVDMGANLWMGLTKILHWFVPYLSFLMPVLLRPWIVFVFLIAALAWLNRKSRGNIRSWVGTLGDRAAYPVLLHAIVYFTAVTMTAITADHRDLYSDRYYAILLVPVLIVLFVTFDTLVLPHLRLSVSQVNAGLIVLFALWSAYPFYTMNEYLRQARREGEPSSVNLFNNRKYNEMDLIAATRQLRESEPNAVVYSNYVDAVWFYTRKPVTLLPFVNEDSVQSLGDWPADKPGYIVWFEPNEYKHYISPAMIDEFADIKIIYEGKGGNIYYVQAR